MRERWPALALGALLLFCSLGSLRVIARDQVPPVADGSGYYRTAVAWSLALRAGRPAELWQRTQGPQSRPPLPLLLTSLLFAGTGQASVELARLSVLPFLWLLLICTYALGARLRDRPTGLLAATLLASYPQVIGYSRIYWMDLPLAAVTALSLWALLASDGLRDRRGSLGLGLAAGLGLLTKFSFLIFLLGPLVAVGRDAWRAERGQPARRRALLRNAALALLAAGLLAGPWYAPMLGSAWRNFVYNQGAGPLEARDWWTLRNLLGCGRDLYVQLGPLQLGLLLLALPGFWRTAPEATWRLLLGWLLLPYLFFSYAVLGIEWSRFTLPYLPALALATACGLRELRLPPLARLTGPLAALLSLASYLYLSHAPGPPPGRGEFLWNRVLGAGLLAPASSSEQADLRRLVRTLAASAPAGPAEVAVFPDYGTIASVLSVLALEERRPLLFSVPYAPESASFGGRFAYPARAFDPGYLLAFPQLVRVLPPEGAAPRLRLASALRRLEAIWPTVQGSFEARGELGLPNGYRLLWYRRR